MTTPTNHTTSAAFFLDDDDDDDDDESDGGNNGRLQVVATDPILAHQVVNAGVSQAPGPSDAAAPAPVGQEEEKSRISTASSIEESNILHQTESKSGHSRLSSLLGQAAGVGCGADASAGASRSPRKRPTMTAGGNGGQLVLSPLSDQDRTSNNKIDASTGQPDNNQTQSGILRPPRYSVSGNKSSINNANKNTCQLATTIDSDEQPMTMSQHMKSPPPPPPPNPPTKQRPPAARVRDNADKDDSNNDDVDDEDGSGTTFTAGTNTTHTFGAVPGNVLSETLHTSNIRSSLPLYSTKASDVAPATGNANAITKYNSKLEPLMCDIDDAEVDEVAAWIIHFALVFFVTLVVAAVILSLNVMANYGFVTLLFLAVLVVFVAGLGWYVDRTILSRNPKLRPIRRKLMTVVEAAKKTLVEEYHFFVQDWKEHQLLLSQSPHNFASDDEYDVDAGDNTDGLLHPDGSSSNEKQQGGRKKSKIFKLVKPFLGLGKKISLRRKLQRNKNSNTDPDAYAEAAAGEQVNVNTSSFQPPPTSNSNLSSGSSTPAVHSVAV